jgi:hypothetical protein
VRRRAARRRATGSLQTTTTSFRASAVTAAILEDGIAHSGSVIVLFGLNRTRNQRGVEFDVEVELIKERHGRPHFPRVLDSTLAAVANPNKTFPHKTFKRRAWS